MNLSTTTIKPFLYEVLDGFAHAGGLIRSKEKSLAVPAEEIQEEVQELAPPPAPTFSLEELEVAKNLAREEGISKGYADAKTAFETQQQEQNTKIAELTNKLAEEITVIKAQIEQRQNLFNQDFAQISVSLAKAICSNLDEKLYLEQAESLIKQALSGVEEGQKIKITLNPKNAAELNDKFTGITLNASEDIALGDFRVEWQNGYLEHDSAKIWAEMEQILTKHFNK